MTRSRSKSTALTFVALGGVLLLSGCGGTTLDQSSGEAAAASVIRLIATGDYEQACEGMANGVRSEAPNLYPDSADSMESCIERAEQTNAVWEKNGVLDEAQRAEKGELSNVEDDVVAVNYPSLGWKNQTLQAIVLDVDGTWYMSTYGVPYGNPDA